MSANVLIVDDDLDMARAIADALESAGQRCAIASSGAAALEACRAHDFGVVVSDVRMEGMDGLELMERLQQVHGDLPVVLLTGAGSIPAAVDAVKRGAAQYIVKPADRFELQQAVARVLASVNEPARSPRKSDPPAPAAQAAQAFVGSGSMVTALRKRIELVAAATSPVLIQGETGTGKELVARAIHAGSARAKQPFVTVNASAIPEALLESEMFGHVRGAFTGAAQAHRGLFAEADGGTLLLDEVGDMPLLLQPKLLRVLQSGEFRAVGGDRVHKVDVRVIAATHRDLAERVQAGLFREDLYYRLNVVPIKVPPLRDRREDIPELATHLLARAKMRATSSPVESISPGLIELLAAASWPGNVRELESVIERLVVLSRDRELAARHLALVEERVEKPAPAPLPEAELYTVERLIERHVEAILAHTSGNKPRAVEILGIDLSTLYRWQRKWRRTPQA